MKGYVCVFLIFLALFAVPPILLAQFTTGGIAGTVSDESGAVLPGVTVTVTGANIAAMQTYVTGGQGSYRFPTLPPGSYDVTFVLDGFATLSRQQIVVSVGGIVALNAALPISQLSETVTVIGETPVVDTRSTHLDTTYDREWVENAPTKRFVFFDYINAAPGVSQTSYYSSSSSVMGSGSDENTYQMDGVNITTSAFGNSWPWPNIDAIEEVEVLTLGAPAEHANASGGVFNIITRQGNNDFSGDVNFYFQSQGLTARNTTDEEDDGWPWHRDEFTDVTGQIGGPIVKDKLWFFFGYQYQKDSLSQPGADPNFPSPDINKRYIGKLNYQINDSNKLSFMFHLDDFNLAFGATANDAPSTVGYEWGKSPAANLTYTNIVSQNTLLEGHFSGFWSDDHNDPLFDGFPRVAPRFYNLDTGEITGGLYYWYDSDVFKSALDGKVTHYAEDFLGGNHDFKFGVQWETGGINGNVGYNDLIYTYEYYGYKYGYGYRYGDYAYSGIATNLGVWIDDSIQVNNRLTLNLGVRFDYKKASIDNLVLQDFLRNPTGVEFPGNDNLYSWTPFSPRLGFNYSLTEDGSTVIKAHYGRYYRQIITCEYCLNIGGSPHDLAFGYWDFEAQDFTDLEVFGHVPGNVGIDTNYVNPYTDQVIFGFDRQLGSELSLQINYAYKRGRDYAAWRDLTGVYENTVYIDDQGADATGAAIPVQRLVSDPADRFFEIANDDRMNTKIHALTFQVVKRMSNKWQMNSSLSYTNTSGVLPSGRASATGSQRTSLLFSSFGQNPNDFINIDGRLAGERRWMFKTQFLYRFPWDVLTAVSYTGLSGRAYQRQIRVPDLGIPTTINAEVRDGSRAVDPWNLLDVRLQKQFAIGQNARLGLFLDALNLFNDDANENVLSRNGTSSSFDIRSRFLPPRRLQIGVKFLF